MLQVIQSITSARIRISKANVPIIYDLCDNCFTIQANQQQFIEILAPNGGEVFATGCIISIKFTNPQMEARVKLCHKTRATRPWFIGLTYTLSAQTTTIWFVAPIVKSGKSLIKLESTLNPFIFDSCFNYNK